MLGMKYWYGFFGRIVLWEHMSRVENNVVTLFFIPQFPITVKVDETDIDNDDVTGDQDEEDHDTDDSDEGGTPAQATDVGRILPSRKLSHVLTEG